VIFKTTTFSVQGFKLKSPCFILRAFIDSSCKQFCTTAVHNCVRWYVENLSVFINYIFTVFFFLSLLYCRVLQPDHVIKSLCASFQVTWYKLHSSFLEDNNEVDKNNYIFTHHSNLKCRAWIFISCRSGFRIPDTRYRVLWKELSNLNIDYIIAVNNIFVQFFWVENSYSELHSIL